MDGPDSVAHLFCDSDDDEYGPPIQPCIAEPTSAADVEVNSGWLSSDSDDALPSQKQLAWDTDTDTEDAGTRGDVGLVHNVLFDLQPKAEKRGRKRLRQDVVSDALVQLGESMSADALKQLRLCGRDTSDGQGSTIVVDRADDYDESSFEALLAHQRLAALLFDVDPVTRQAPNKLSLNRSHLATLARISANRVPAYAMVS
jgi:hypothetical protein